MKLGEAVILLLHLAGGNIWDLSMLTPPIHNIHNIHSARFVNYVCNLWFVRHPRLPIMGSWDPGLSQQSRVWALSEISQYLFSNEIIAIENEDLDHIA